ncbi:MAG: aminotransferase class I/II-fold pyridoxal phosphate-dependent enzyme [Prevotella sp.]|nr:aminotransferase class I/II-fold pyridoxal phosphate-dependent enzyme [Prevotella sp.]
MIEGHGDDIYHYDEEVKMNFSSTNFMHADHSALKAYLMERFDLISNYPEPQPLQLEKLMAEKLGIAPESVMVTNGATEAIYLIAALYSGSTSIIPQPTSTEYADACRIHRHVITYEQNEVGANLPKERVYWLCNPNNPSGNVLMKSFVDYLVRRSPQYNFVVDQSFEAFTKEPLLVPRETCMLQNLLLVHSMSKTYGIPGIRLGYITGHPNTIQMLRNLRQPWAVSTLAIETGKFLVKQGRPVVEDIKAYLDETERLRTALRQIEGIRVYETKTNYMLCEIQPTTALDLKSYLIHNHGILIRDCYNFTGLSTHFFRVTTQLPAENDTLISAIHEYMQS